MAFSKTLYAPVKSKRSYDFKSLTLTELDGNASLLAEKMAEAKGFKPGSEGFELERVRLAITHVDGIAIPGGPDIVSWGNRSRLLAHRGYMDLNAVEDDEARDFLAGKPLEPDPKSGTVPSDG